MTNVEKISILIHNSLTGAYQSNSFDNLNLTRREKVDYEVITLIVKSVYQRFTESNILESIKLLESKNVLRKVQKDSWKVLVFRRPFPISNVNTGWASDWIRNRDKDKPGICPDCGQSVNYANRHARAGTSHTGEDCSFNKIKSVIED